MHVTLQNWSTCSPDDGFVAPELRRTHIQGNVYGHPKHKDGDHIVSSYVVEVIGRTIITRSGTVYWLGKIAPKFRRWIKKEGRTYDPKNPIIVRS